eukprot:CAMPEP_0172377298 /NCGR_PEP_ID=MMETSP1060-20121228/68832_1 /TAXON_ID=37318 /ORGANISM="Pseudo-nitzschia pungens, Strain cf. cingulata" /LENGTH=230 /DNA_ID=CAMNT_0013104979 /DNA_START=117 /DNA_END=809 /DNA_ORIENTATION=+
MPIRKVIRVGRRSPVDDERENGIDAQPTKSSLHPKEFKEGSMIKNDSKKNSSVMRKKKVKGNKICPLGESNGARRDPSEKSVRWYPKVAKKRHIQIKDMKEEERENVWCSEQDTKMILAMAKVTVKMMMNGDHCDDIDYCSRGLEGKTVVGSKQRSKNKQLIRRAVLKEQEVQRMYGVNRPEEIAKVSFKCSEYIVAEARHKAIRDQEEAQEFLIDVRINQDLLRKVNVV